jgi:DNA polymerase-3 subunit alpha/error-prone DNA polymerase
MCFCGTNVEIQIPLDIPRGGGKFLVYPRDLDTGKTMQLHDTNSVVALVAEIRYARKIPSTQHAFLRSIEECYKLHRFRNAPKAFPLFCLTYITEDIGFEKFDSQRGIGHIDDTVKLVKKAIGSILEIRHCQKNQSAMIF